MCVCVSVYVRMPMRVCVYAHVRMRMCICAYAYVRIRCVICNGRLFLSGTVLYVINNTIFLQHRVGYTKHVHVI